MYVSICNYQSYIQYMHTSLEHHAVSKIQNVVAILRF